MGKLISALFVLFAIQIAMVIFLGVSFPGNSLYQLVIGPEGWANMSFYDWITSTITLSLGIAAIVGLYWNKTDIALWCAVAAVFSSFGATYFEGYQQVATVFAAYAVPDLLSVLIFVPFLLPWFLIILDYIRGRD